MLPTAEDIPAQLKIASCRGIDAKLADLVARHLPNPFFSMNVPPAPGPLSHSLTLCVDLSEVARARQLVSEVGADAGFCEEKCFDMQVACSEACANAIEHSPSGAVVEVEILLYHDRLEVKVEGPGPFELPAVAARDRTHRGLGLPLMAKLSDHFALYSGPRGGTLVALTFYRPGFGDEYADDVTRPSVEALLRQGEADLERAQELAKAGSWRLDTRRNELTWSAEAYRIFGVPRGTSLSYETFLSFVHPEDRASVNERWAAALKGEPYDIEHRVVVADEVKWVHERAGLEIDAQGVLLGGFGSVQDITERKRAEEARRRREESLARLLSTAGRLRVFERRSAWLVFLIGAVVQGALFLGVDQLGSPSRYLGIPGAATALVGVVAAIVAGPATGIAVALVGGAAYFAFITDFGASVAWPAIVISILLWILAAAVAGLAGDWVRRGAVSPGGVAEPHARRAQRFGRLAESRQCRSTGAER